MASDAYNYAVNSGMGVDQYYKNIRDYVAANPSPEIISSAADRWGISVDDINAAMGSNAWQLPDLSSFTPTAASPVAGTSDAYKYAVNSGMGVDQYYQNIRNFANTNPSPAVIAQAADRWGISVDDINAAMGNNAWQLPGATQVQEYNKQISDYNKQISDYASQLKALQDQLNKKPQVPQQPQPVTTPTLPSTNTASPGMGSAVTPPTYAPILPSVSVADYGIGLLPGETTYESPLGTIAGGATFLAPQYSRPLPAGVSNYGSVTSAPRVTAEIAGLPRWVQERVSSGPDFMKSSTGSANFKKGGLARFADGGQFSENDDLTQQQQDLLKKLSTSRNAITAPELASDALQQRAELLSRVQSSPAFAPVEEPSTAQQIGEAMMRGSAAGPANIGQLIGRSGSAYFDAQKERQADNQRRALAGLNLEERVLPDARLGSIGASKSGSPSPEQVRTVYQTSLNKNAQIAKEQGPWKSAEARNNWIRQQAEKDVEVFLSRFAVNANVPRGTQEAEAPVTAPLSGVVAPGPKPGIFAKPFAPGIEPTESAPPARKLPEEARQKTFATGSEEMAMKDYSENIAPAAKVADSMLNVVDTIRQIPHTQDMFAPWREKVGAAFDAVGLDGKVVREARNIKQIMPLLTKLANDRLLLAKGVQTEGDAQRAFNEFVKITDPKEAADFLYNWTKEIANRAKFKNELYRASKDREGTWQRGEEYWNKSDYAQTPPMARLNGKSWSFSEWRDKFLKANAKKGATIQDAIKAWNNLTRGE